MTIKFFQKINKIRCEQMYHKIDDWSESDWAVALAGETGELCNFIKKRRRGDDIHVSDCAKELADVVTYAVLFAEKLNIDLETYLIDKFNEVSDRMKCDIKIEHD